MATQKKSTGQKRTRSASADTKSSQSQQNTTEKTSGDFLSQAAEFYLDLIEQSAPKMKAAADDLYEFGIGSAKTIVKAQKAVLDGMGIKSSLISKSEDLFNKTADEMTGAQKKISEITTTTVTNSVKLVRDGLNVQEK